MSSSFASDKGPYLEVTKPQDTTSLSKYIEVYEDLDWSKNIEGLATAERHLFSSMNKPSPDFGFTQNRIWLRVSLENKTDDIHSWYLHVHENFLQNYAVYLERADGSISYIDQHEPITKFSERSVQSPELASKFHFEPNEKITLYMAYWSGGSSKISLSLETEKSYSDKSIRQASKSFVSYGMMLILIFTSTLALILLRLKVFLAYSVYVIVTLLFLMHSDGVAFQYLWPNHPNFNSYFSIIIGLAFAIVPYNFARVFLRTRKFHPRIDKLMIVIMIITPIIIIPSAFIDPQWTKKMLMLLVLLAISIGIFAGVVASLSRFKEVRFYLFAWIFGFMSAGLMNLRHFTSLGIIQATELDSIRVSIVVDAVMMGLGVADRYRQQMKESRQEERDALKYAELNLRLNTRLQSLEEKYVLATELVTSRDVELKNTVHDLRQPLHALRLSVKNLQTKTGKEVIHDGRFEETFSYLETLISGYLQDSVRVENAETTNDQDLSLSKILLTIHEMFLPDAQDKNIDFRYVRTTKTIDIEPLVLMRVVTNLVSNAIKYTPHGKVLLGVRQQGDSIRVEIHDTGPGMSETDFIFAQSRAVRLDESSNEGHGLGLAIARDLVKKNGYELLRLERLNGGTSVALVLRPS